MLHTADIPTHTARLTLQLDTVHSALTSPADKCAEEHSWALEIIELTLACDHYHVLRQFLGRLRDIPRKQLLVPSHLQPLPLAGNKTSAKNIMDQFVLLQEST